MAQVSSIKKLPDDVLDKLQELLRDPRVTQLEATRRINLILEDEGHEDRVSKSAVNRYAVKMEEVGAKLRQSREVAKMWIGRLGAEPQGEVGKLLNEMVRTLAFEVTMNMAEGEIEKVDPRMLRDMSIAIEKLEKAASENVKREAEIRKKALEEAANVIDKHKRKTLDPETLRVIREEVYGLV